MAILGTNGGIPKGRWDNNEPENDPPIKKILSTSHHVPSTPPHNQPPQSKNAVEKPPKNSQPYMETKNLHAKNNPHKRLG
jgi:hypothetical protein